MEDKVEKIIDYAKKQFDTQPEHLWKKYPNYAVLRNKCNKKWYAVIMDVARKNLGLKGEEISWVVNVKCDPMMIGSFIKRKGFLPAYHMNKDHWISVIADDSYVSTKEILNLIDMSYEIVDTSTKSKRKRRTH